MAEIILFLVFLIPAMLGLAEILHILKLYILYPKTAASYVLVFLKGENASEQLMLALEQYFWLGKRYARNIIAVDMGLNGESLKVCRKIALRHNVIFCSEKELDLVLKRVK